MTKIQEAKEKFINFLKERGEYFRVVHEGQYNIRCPFCGDTQKTKYEGHLYIKADVHTEDGIVYNCFKCGEFGYLSKDLLDALECDEELEEQLLTDLKGSKKKRVRENAQIDFNFKLPEIDLGSKKLDYVKGRLGIDFKEEDFKKMKVITSLADFLATNKIKYRPVNDYVLGLLQKYYVGFLTNGSSHILFRDTTDTQKYAWIKYPIVKDSMQNRVFYTIDGNGLDIFTENPITINLSEGVMDAIGVAYHFKYMKDNTMNIAVSGKQYGAMISYLISLGLVGSNVIINIFSDNDENFNKDKKRPNKLYDTSFTYLRKSLEKYRVLFKQINLYHNVIAKDYGKPKNEICLKKEPL